MTHFADSTQTEVLVSMLRFFADVYSHRYRVTKCENAYQAY